ATTTLTIVTTGPSAALKNVPAPRRSYPIYASLTGGILGAVFMALGFRNTRTGKSGLLLAIIVLTMVALLASCGGGSGTPPVHDPGTPPGTSQITVTTSGGGTSHNPSITFTVTN